MENRAERTVLNPGDTLVSPGRDYIVDSCIGCGSNAIVYLGHYTDHQIRELRHRILIKELFPFDGAGKIFRNVRGDIIVEPEAEEFYAVHEESYRRGNIFHADILNEHPGELDFFIDTFSYHNTLYSILEFTGGRSALREIGENGNLSLERAVVWMREILNILKVFHDAGYLHLDISLDNILLTGSGEKERVSLIDYNSSVSVEAVHGSGDIILSSKEGYEYTAPEILRGDRKKIGPCTDLYSVTAVFFRLLFGRGRTAAERISRFIMPDISRIDTLNGQYPIVIDMIASILRKGFRTNSGLRYQSAEQMLSDLKELEERMKCRGITQWALWQKGRDRAVNIIRRNTALHYIMDPEKMYPLKAQRTAAEDTENILLSDDNYLKKMTGRRPVLLLGSGGMGKTTAMLRLAYGGSGKYTDRSTAVVYISLFDWREGDRTYIQDKILEYMDYSHELQENARKELRRLLSDAIRTKSGDIPRLLLCLDGLNEASGDISSLLDEIQELCVLSGVKIILTSRSEIVGDEYEKWTLARLTAEEVRIVLRSHQVPNPENMEIMEMLQVPMMLSMYLEALDGRKMIKLNSRDELMEEYLAVLTVKEARDALHAGTAGDVQNSPAYFGAQAAVKYVLPEIAALIEKKKRALTEKELFRCAEECYRYLDKKAFTAVFEKWIGHVKQLKLGASNADEWYGRIVQTILWQKLGLLVKDEEGNYRIVHQIIEEYMAQKSKEFHADFDREKKKLRNRKRIYIGSSAAATVFLLVSLFAVYNLSVNRRLTQQNREILQNESEALAFRSEELLANGDRLGAVETALAALPTEGNDRPYVASAENALADALYVYQDEQYRSAYQITPNTDITAYDVSEDGSTVVILDGYDVLKQYQNGSLSWMQDIGDSIFSSDDDSYVTMQYLDLENEDFVLVAREWDDVFCYQADTGECCWSCTSEDMGISYLSSAVVSSDCKVLAVCGTLIEEEDEDGNRARIQKTAFIDTETGNIISETDTRNTGMGTDSWTIEDAEFIKENNEFLCVWHSGDVYQILAIDVQTGMILQDPWVKNENGKYYVQVKTAYISENKYNAGGIFIYVCEYEYSTFDSGDTGSARVGFLPDGADEWEYWDDNTIFTGVGAVDGAAPEIYTNKNGLIIVSGESGAVQLSFGGTVIAQKAYNQAVIYQYAESANEIRLFFEDGTTTLLNIGDAGSLDLWSDQPLLASHIYSFLSIEDTVNDSIVGAAGCRTDGGPFACILEEEKTTVNVIQPAGDDPCTELEWPQSQYEDFISGEIYEFPDESGFLHMDNWGIDVPEGSDDSYWNKIVGTAYNNEGKIIDTFSFEGPVSGACFSCLSGDGSRLFYDSNSVFYVYDRAAQSFQKITSEGMCGHTVSERVGEDVITAALTENEDGDLSIAYWTDGEDPQEILLPEDIGYYDVQGLAVGQCGDIVLLYYDEDDVPCFCSCNLRDREWGIAAAACSEFENVCMAAGNTSDTAAFVNDADELVIWDDMTDDSTCHVFDIAYGSAVIDIRFILQDQYILAVYETGEELSASAWIDIIDAKTGEIVYEYYPEELPSYNTILTKEEQNGSRLYVYTENGDMPGLCIDTDTWETVYEIPDLCCVLSDSYVGMNIQTIKKGVLYSTADLISMGQALLNF